jgi:CRP/FNR family transcriptional regulator
MKETQVSETSDKKNLRLLRKVPFFAQLEEEELGPILAHLQERQISKNETIFREGTPGEYLFMIRSGNVKIYKLSEEGKEQILAVFGPGDFFAELPLLDGGKYPASAEALTVATLVRLSRENFLNILSDHPSVVTKILETVGARLRHFTNMVADLTLKDASRRLAGFLYEKAKRQDLLLQKEVRFPMELTHQEIASLIGTARETVSRTLQQFQKEEIIEIKDRHVTVLDMNRLSTAAR